MAGDWIKMRLSLVRDPSVIAMADALAVDREFMNWLTGPVRKSCNETAYEHVTRNVTVPLCVTSLLVTWGTANEIGKVENDDLLLEFATIDTLDEMSGVPGFGQAMAYVNWAIEEINNNGKSQVRLPNFLIHNSPFEDRQKKSNAERQRRYREKKKAEANEKRNVTHNVTRDVTHNVTVTTREEKRRVLKDKEKNIKKESAKKRFSKPTVEQISDYCRERNNAVDAQAFYDHYESNGWRVGRTAMKDWKAAIRTWERNHATYQQRPANQRAAIAQKIEQGAREAVTELMGETAIRENEGDIRQPVDKPISGSTGYRSGDGGMEQRPIRLVR